MKKFDLIIDDMVVAEDQPISYIKNLTKWTKKFDGLRTIKFLIDKKFSFKYKENLDFPDEIILYLFDFDIVIREKDESKKEKWEKIKRDKN